MSQAIAIWWWGTPGSRLSDLPTWRLWNGENHQIGKSLNHQSTSAIWLRNDRRPKAEPHVAQAEPERYAELAVRCVQPEWERRLDQPEKPAARCDQHAAPEHRVRF